jgi:cobalamin synthase
MDKDKNPLVGIAGVVAVMLVAMTLALALFAQEQVWVLSIVAPCLAFMGIMLGYYASRKK